MDCEMVGVGPKGEQNALARCSLVNYYGDVLYDKFVRVTDTITDYRTHVSGIRHADLISDEAVSFDQCQTDVAKIIDDRIVVGHALSNDFQALLLSHPRKLIRDTAKCKIFCPARPRGLRALLKEHLDLDIQAGEHSSVEDARSVMALYRMVRPRWEKLAKNKGDVKLAKALKDAKRSRLKNDRSFKRSLKKRWERRNHDKRVHKK
jgi:RNA exonuclease 4